MEDKPKQNKKDDKPKLEVAKNPFRLNIDARNNHPLNIIGANTGDILNFNPDAYKTTGPSILGNKIDWSSAIKIPESNLINPNSPDYWDRMTSLNSSIYGPENNAIFMPQKPEEKLTMEDVEKLLDKKSGMTAKQIEQATELFNRLTENKNKQENESILAVNKNGLDFIAKELLRGKRFEWHCAKCRNLLEEIEGEESIEKVKKYIINFSHNIFKKCKNGHQNWFEIKEDGIVWLCKVIFEKEFD